ncbi:unnamed protein product [Phaeothamnion confervicola]
MTEAKGPTAEERMASEETSASDDAGTYEICSQVPAGLEGKSVVMGIDEAGRGPVLGPMVYGCAYWSEEHDAELSKAGFDDSKALKEEQRDKLFQRIREHPQIGFAVRLISARELSQKMLRRVPYSLNGISHAAAVGLVRGVQARGVTVSHVFVDTVGDPGAYEAMLSREFGPDVKFTVAKKADSLYKTVSAASICAKVTRDGILRRWEYRERSFAGGTDYGSGYPGDARCKAWMEKHLDPVFGFPELCRFSWSTTKELLKEKGARVEWEEEEEDGKAAAAAGTARIDSFMRPAGKKPRASYFRVARMEIVDAF